MGASSQALGTGAEKRRHTRKFQNRPSLLRRGCLCTSNQMPSMVQRKQLLEAKPWVGFMPFLKGGFDPRGLSSYDTISVPNRIRSAFLPQRITVLGAGQCRQSRATWLVSKRRIRPRDGFDVIPKEDSGLHNVSWFLGHVTWSTNSNSSSSPLKFNRASLQVGLPLTHSYFSALALQMV